MSGILEGVRVLDLSRGIAGSLTTLLLAEQGADVIKVEPPGGDPFREVYAGYFIWNRSKRSVTLDLQEPRDRDALLRLLETADVLLESYQPGELAALGL